MREASGTSGKTNPFWKNAVGIALGFFGATLIGGMVNSFFSFYLTDVMYLPAGFVGLVIGASAIVDGVTDFIMGVLEDNTSSRWGKARGWVLLFALPLALSMAFLFAMPVSLSVQAKMIYILIFYNLYCLAHTIVHLPLATYHVLMSVNPRERALFSTVSMFFSMGTAILLSNSLIPLVNAFGSGPKGYRNTAFLFAVTGLICLLLSVALTREIPLAGEKGSGFSLGKLLHQLKCLFTNKYWWLMNLCAALNSFGFMIINSMQMYYCRYVLGDLTKIGVLFSCATLSQMAAMPVAAPLIARFGKRRTAIAGGFLSLIGYAIILIDPTNFFLLCVGMVIRGVFFAPINACESAFFADTVDYGEWKTGERQDGLVFSVKSTLNKMISSVITAGLGFALARSGYAGELDVQPASAVSVIKGLFIFGPIVAYTLCTFSLLLFRLDKKMPRILSDLEARRAGNKESRKDPAERRLE